MSLGVRDVKERYLVQNVDLVRALTWLSVVAEVGDEVVCGRSLLAWGEGCEWRLTVRGEESKKRG